MKQKRRKKTERGDKEEALGVRQTEQTRPVVTVDYKRYAHLLEDSDLTEEQKVQLLQALWTIIVEFVSLGFGVHPLQQVKDACGKPDGNSSRPERDDSDQIECSDAMLTNRFIGAADLEAETEAEGIER